MSQQSDNANTLAATNASQPSVSSCSAGAKGSDVGAAQPSISRSNISPIVTEVLEFGRIPKRCKRPITEEEQEENALANRYYKQKQSLSHLDRLRLDELTEESKKKKKKKEAEAQANQKKEPDVQALVAEILEFGRMPKEIYNPMTQEKQKESKLALRYRKKKKIFLTWTGKNLPRSQEEQ